MGLLDMGIGIGIDGGLGEGQTDKVVGIYCVQYLCNHRDRAGRGSEGVIDALACQSKIPEAYLWQQARPQSPV